MAIIRIGKAIIIGVIVMIIIIIIAIIIEKIKINK